jgi:peptidoglycan/xylan/chitin deacetylase (PgdA/CDA1 family)
MGEDMIHVIWNEERAQSIWRQGRDVYAAYWFEMLRQAGLSHRKWTSSDWLKEKPAGVTILISELEPIADWAEVFRAYCKEGNALLAAGASYGLDELLGVKTVKTVKEGFIGWEGAELASGLRSSFHFFGGVLVKPLDGVQASGKIQLRTGAVTEHPALTLKENGSGAAALIAVDLARTFQLIQQGVPVLKDGVPADDGTGAIHEDILKTDDGCVLDWNLDRETAGGEKPYFIHPVVDEFRILLIRLLHRLHQAASQKLAQVWFWPNGLEAIGHISHDTDGNLPEAASMMISRLEEADVRTTWCVIMPGYPDEIYKRVIEGGHEIALHYNALETEGQYWDEELFNEQLEMLKSQMARLGHEAPILTNKNHYLRWEGDVQFYKWCERAGIVMEQSKGGTKQGNKGFLAGTCHPYLPASDPSEHNRLMNVYSCPTLAWDPPVPLRCTLPEAKALLDRSKDVYGVAHFLYHPATFKLYADVGPGFVELIRYGKEQGLEWWTSAELYEWLELRRGIQAEIQGGRLVITADKACNGVTVLLPGDSVVAAGAEAVRSVNRVKRYGMDMAELILDLPQGETVIPLQ